MALWDRLMERATGMRDRPTIGNKKSVMSLACEKTGDIRPYTLDANEEYELRLTLSVSFWANQAQREEARRIAERHLAHILYADALGALAMVRSMISDGDRDAALVACANLERELTQTSP